MYKDEQGRVHESTDEIREATDVKGMVTVLISSTALVSILFLAVWWFWMR